MTTYVAYITDERGDIVDILYFCSSLCHERWLERNKNRPYVEEGGACPAPESLDYPVKCALEECDSSAYTPLTDEGVEYTRELILDNLERGKNLPFWLQYYKESYEIEV